MSRSATHTAPAAVIRLPLEGKPSVRLDVLNEGEQSRLVDWIESHDDLAALVARALEAIETRRVA